MQSGDLVRIRTRKEIEATLDSKYQLKGCLFMAEMWDYCGKQLRVLKPVKRFLDECEYHVRRTSGIVILEGAICRGTVYPQGCDHSCYFFWRKEWLGKIV